MATGAQSPDTFEVNGFLSAEMEVFCTNYRHEFAKEFERCENLCSQATQQLFGTELSTAPAHIVLAVSFWSRCVSACQGAVILIERGMSADGQTLIRSAVEFLFFAVALLKDAGVVARMEGQDNADKLKQARSMLKEGVAGGHLNPEQKIDLEEIIATTPPSSSSISAYDAAQIAGLGYIYQTVYRGLSLASAHGTLTSTNNFFIETDDGLLGMEFGPKPNGIKWSLELTSNCMSAGLDHFATVLCGGAA